MDNLGRRYARVQKEIQRLHAMDRTLDETPDGQISLIDPDARAMATSAKNSGLVGYNVQAAVDTGTHLIVTHDVTNHCHDRDQLAPTAIAAKAALDRSEMHAVADKGYFNGREILACHDAGIVTTVPRPETSGNRKKGLFVKADFVYEAEADVYRCPADEELTYRYTRDEDGLKIRRYWTGACRDCPLKRTCTTAKERRIARWEHEHLVDQMQARISGADGWMRLRRATVEHPFGTIKAWMGATHFQMRRLKNVRTEMALHVLAYNIKRMLSIIGVPGMMAALAP